MQKRKWCLIGLSPFLFGFAPSFESDLAQALKGANLSGTAFHRTVLTLMKRHGKVVGYYNKGPRFLQHTAGDGRARLLWANGGGFNIEDLYLIWKEGEQVRVQRLDMPKDDGWQVFQPGYLRGNELIFCDAAYAGGNWWQPCIRVYEKVRGSWKLKQNIYAGGKETRTGLAFERRNGKVDISRADGQVRVYPAHVSAPNVGPLLTYNIRFERIGGTYKQTLYKRVETPLAALDDLAAMRAKGNRAGFDQRVPKSIRERLWKALAVSDNLRVSTNSHMVEDHSRVLRVPGWEIAFRKVASRWAPRSIKPYKAEW
jgi:hypothetical protein